MHYYEDEIKRIQTKLKQYLSEKEARQTAARMIRIIEEVDEEIDRILRDPLVLQLYEYDGKFFTPRGTQLFHRAFNGINILQSLTNSTVEAYFRSRHKDDAIEWFIDELGGHIWEAKVRRLNWEDSGSLRCLTDEVIDAVLRQHNERMRRKAELDPPQLSTEEETFFKSYEDEIGTDLLDESSQGNRGRSR